MEDDGYSGPEADTKVAVPHPTSRPPLAPMESLKPTPFEVEEWLDEWREPLMIEKLDAQLEHGLPLVYIDVL